jgi:hypothetical protein
MPNMSSPMVTMVQTEILAKSTDLDRANCTQKEGSFQRE